MAAKLRSPFRSSRSGMTLAEVAVGIVVISLFAVVLQAAYRFLFGDAKEVRAATSLQRQVKYVSSELETDFQRAGFGLHSSAVFLELAGQGARFRYRDALGANCAVNDTVTVEYRVVGRELVKQVGCNGAVKYVKKLSAAPDSLALTFRYLDNSGRPTTTSGNVRTVEYDLEFTAGPLKKSARRRTARGNISVVNNK